MPASGARSARSGSDADPAELADLFRRHHAELVRIAALLVRGQPTAEDIAQDVFARIHSRPGIRPQAGLELAYLRASVLNGCRSVHRRRALARRLGIEAPSAADLSVAVIDGRTCNASDSSGCGHAPAMIDLKGYAAGITVDDADHAVYVSDESGYVSVIDRDTCDAVDTAGCASLHASVPMGRDSRGDVFDAGASTVYVTNGASNTVSMIDTRTCSAVSAVSCGRAQSAFPVRRVRGA